MSRDRVLSAIAASLAVVFATTCGDAGGGPGTMVVALETVAPDDGAVVIEVRGGPMEEPSPVDDAYLFYARQPTELFLSVAVIGDIESGDLFTFRVPSTDLALSYQVTLREVADRSNRLREPPDEAYHLTIRRWEE